MQTDSICSVGEITIYLPDELEAQLNAEVTALGISKAELIGRGVDMLLDSSIRPNQAGALPVFNSGRDMSAHDMDNAIYDHVKQQAARR